jgi:spoIIIJ-associated protein
MAENKFKIEEEIQNLVTQLLDLMGVVAKSFVEVTETSDAPVYTVNIDTEEQAGLLIGNRGETLTAIQSFLSIALKQKTGDWVRVVVNIGDWREKQEDYLKNLATQAAERARETGVAQPIYNLNSAQRRIIHMELSKMEDLITESEGEGFERYLVVRVK